MSNNLTETPLPNISALNRVASQEASNERSAKQQLQTNKHESESESKCTFTLGFDMEYTNRTIQSLMPTLEKVKKITVLNSSSQIVTEKADITRSSSVEGVEVVANGPIPKKDSSVTFAPNTKPPKAFRPSKIGYKDPPQRNQTKFGKANLARDIPIFVGIIAILLFFAFQMGEIGEISNNGVKESPTAKLDRLKASIEEQMNKKKEIYENRMIGCNLFLADSTIPGAGLSLFSGTHYNKSATVLQSSLAFKFIQNNKTLIDYALLLKHHPLLANLKGDVWMLNGNNGNSTMTMKASQEIFPGQELFLSFDDHPASSHLQTQLFLNIPIPTDFELADKIVKDEIITQTGTRRTGERPSGGGTEALKLIQRTVAKFAPGVAQLLPTHKSRLDRFKADGTPSVGYSMMRNRTLTWLELHGRCLDLVERKEDGVTVARMAIQQGKTVSIMPLFAIERNLQHNPHDKSCSTRATCFGHTDSSIRLCPMSAISHVSHTNDPSLANAEYQWSSWNTANFDSFGRSLIHLMNETAHKISFDIHATKPIAVGDEIVLDIGNALISDFIPTHTGMFPELWLDLREGMINKIPHLEVITKNDETAQQ